ncbi:MAG: hypothetical protein FWH33_01855 [Oscillospiraceae bacterium]|nr:hypothetical protein [Oscillospiraceae bacterium]
MTPKENYLRMMRGEIPEFVPSGFYEPYSQVVEDELLTPRMAPDGPIVTALGVKYVGAGADLMFGAMPEPNHVIIDDISKWRDKLKIKDVSDRDWESYYKNASKDFDRENKCVGVGGGDYWLTLVSLMGFEGALLAMFEEPEEVIELLTEISKFYTMVLKQQIKYLKPEVLGLMDDDAAYRAPFFSVDMYKKIFKPFHKLHADIALNEGMVISRHDCGKCEQYIDDWLDIGITEWNSPQDSNDLPGIKKKYGNKLAFPGGWTGRHLLEEKASEKEIRDSLAEYVDFYAPGGGFTYGAMVMGPMDDPDANRNREIVKNFYYDYVKDWYKNH